MSKPELFKRYVLFIISLFFSALGVSPISSVANVMSYKFSFLSLGTWLIIWNCVLILGQVIILRKNFKLIQFLQVPLSFIFGWFTDFGMFIVSHIPINSYSIQLLMVFAGIIILGFGISLSVIANVIMNSGEAFVKSISDTSGKEFGNIKIAFDIICVVISIVLSLIFFDFSIIGTREGTVISALCTGIVVKFFLKRLNKPIEKILI